MNISNTVVLPGVLFHANKHLQQQTLSVVYVYMSISALIICFINQPVVCLDTDSDLVSSTCRSILPFTPEGQCWVIIQRLAFLIRPLQRITESLRLRYLGSSFKSKTFHQWIFPLEPLTKAENQWWTIVPPRWCFSVQSLISPASSYPLLNVLLIISPGAH